MIHAIARQSKNICLFALFATVIALGAIHANDAEARGFSGSRSSSSSSSRSYSAPRTSSYKPAPRVVQNVTVNRTTVVHQSAPAAMGGGSGGFMSTVAGSFAGTSLANWWNNSSNEEKAEKQRLEDEQKQRDEAAALERLKLDLLIQQQSGKPIEGMLPPGK